MTLLKVKCQVCGAIVEKPWEFEYLFEDKLDTDQIYTGFCSDECRDKKMEEIAREYPESPDLEIECRLDEYIC